MASQFEDINQVETAAGYDFAPQWLAKAGSVEEARKLLIDLCTNFDVCQASVLYGDQMHGTAQMHDSARWEIVLTSSGEDDLTEILPLEKLSKFLNEGLQRDNQMTVKLWANCANVMRHLYFIVVERRLLETTVFVFEASKEFSFSSLAALRLISDILGTDFIENGIIIGSGKQQEQKLTEIEFELLRLKSVGQNNDELAATLKLSPHTVHYLLQHVLKKLGCPNSHSAIAKISKFSR